MGIDVARQVKLIVATHWHDDHVNGISDLVDRCHAAELVFSHALARDEFRKLIALYGNNREFVLDKEKSGVTEMGKALNILKARKAAGPYKPPIMAQADLTLHKSAYCTLMAVSPSPGSIQVAMQEVASIWSELELEASGAKSPRPPRGGVVSPERNHNAVALWLQWGDRRILLGSDLEECGDPLLGWQAVLASKQFPDGVATIIKISHHGSPNGDHDPVWNQIVAKDDPIAILTAYTPGPKGRPAPEDVERIKAKTSKVYATTLPKKTAMKYSPSVEKTIVGVAKSRRSLEKNPGHIQVRWANGAEPDVRTFGAAALI
jgi:beta-lactamase superfamily II metal-dependent hydrolase